MKMQPDQGLVGSAKQSTTCGWLGSIAEYMKVTEEDFIARLKVWHQDCMNELVHPSQLVAWQECFGILQEVFAKLLQEREGTRLWSVLFEYELPRERGRRPDVLLMAGDQLVILEFKGYGTVCAAHVDQVAAYARDIKYYHSRSPELKIYPVLVITKGRGMQAPQKKVRIVGPDLLGQQLTSILKDAKQPVITPEDWIAADYAPLPSLIDAARLLFKDKKSLPQIHRAHSAGIPQTVARLGQISEEAKNEERHLALITGVPGAGKTLVGLQFVYEYGANVEGKQQETVFLSGNGPLVTVLQHALGENKVFVQGVHGFLRQYGERKSNLPVEKIWIFDEAQRAWDASKVVATPSRDSSISEPEDFLRLASKKKDGVLIVGLIGEGQEIHLGEESGLDQWNEAIEASSQPWVVHCPDKIAKHFTAASQVHVDECLNLTASLRSHLAEDVQLWIGQVLAGEIEMAAQAAERVVTQGFDLYVTQSMEAAKQYVQERYAGQNDKRYGLLASSKAKNLARYGVHNGYNDTKELQVGRWYNDLPAGEKSCCRLKEVATEFACQGLELDFPIVSWGDDVWWAGTEWESISQYNSKAKNPHRLRMNSYRVLLSRGRDGMVIFVPPEEKMQKTFEVLRQAGGRVLWEWLTIFKH